MVSIIADCDRLAIPQSDNFLQHTDKMKYPEFAQRLKTLLEQAGAPKTQVACAKWLGFAQPTLNDWLKGEKMPSMPTALLLAEKIGCNVEYLLTGKHSGNVELVNNKQGKVPLISSIQAGMWCEAVDNFHPGDAEDWLPCPDKCSNHTYALRVVGDSMTSPYPGQRTYPEGTIIYVDPDRPIVNGCRVVAKLPDSDEATFKEYREESGKRYLKPINPTYDKIEITDDIRICGVVIGQYMRE